MDIRNRYPALILSALLFITAIGKSTAATDDPQKQKGLKDYYKDYFTMGVAVSPGSLSGPQSDLILRNFGSLTCENVMKPAPIHPEENRYVWTNADLVADYAKANGLKMRGHTLVWHNQTPAWFFKDEQGNPASKELALKRMREHIHQVVGRYKGVVYAWDVVNEVIDDGQKTYRESDWYKICGPDFIAAAFRYAHEADPDALLFYNDYNTENPVKREKIIKMIKGLLDEGVPIHGIGLQGHWSITNPSEQQMRESLDEYAKLGLKIQVTELDLSVYPSGHNNPDDDAFTPEREQKQVEQYKMLFRVFRDYRNVISAVTFWNVSDKSSWLDNFPVRGRKNYPLLFDQDLQPKKAFQEIVNW